MSNGPQSARPRDGADTIVVALAGNPNSGKTTIFNAITGAHQHVGNYPGVTVQKKEGSARHEGRRLHVVDLPGTYSLTAYSVDEVVARKFLLEETPDVVVSIVDSSNLERNLYLATQLMEMNVPLVLAFNKSDIAAHRGQAIDEAQLSDLLGVPIVSTVGHKGKGVGALLGAAVRVADNPEAAVARQRTVAYGGEVEPHVRELAALIAARCEGLDRPRWTAVKLLEDDAEETQRLRTSSPQRADEILQRAKRIRDHIESICGDAPEIVLADHRYGFISGACTEAVTLTVEARHALSDQIDAVLTNRWVGLPLFGLMTYCVFWLTFTLGELPMGWIESGFGSLGGWVEQLWPRTSESVLRSLLVDGAIGGVGGVIVFLPNIMLLFLAIAFLEDSGYMARAAFIMDRLMHKIGLHGRSFIPMMTGFGCSVPAILATRTLETRRDRLTTMLVIPLMSCGARLPIYALIIPAFFRTSLRAPVLWSVYIVGIVLAIVLAKLLRVAVLKGEIVPLLMELPSYRMPTLKGLLVHMWERSWMYLRKAGTIILAVSILLWALTSFPKKKEFDRDYAALADAAKATYLQRIASLSAGLGLPADSDLPVKAFAAELAAAQRQKSFWQGEDGFARAEADKKRAFAALCGGEHGSKPAAFLHAREQIERIRGEFDQAVETNGLAPNTPEYAAARRARDDALAHLREADPAAYATAVRYLDEIKAPLDDRLTALRRQRQAEQLGYSIAGRIGRGMEPALRPLGFDWRIGTALIGAMGAKEVFVAQLGIVYSLGETDERSEELRARLQADYSPLVGYCIMLFCLIGAPCVATIAVTRRESESWKWAIAQWVGLTVIAYVVTLAVYQIGSLFA